MEACPQTPPWQHQGHVTPFAQQSKGYWLAWSHQTQHLLTTGVQLLIQSPRMQARQHQPDNVDDVTWGLLLEIVCLDLTGYTLTQHLASTLSLSGGLCCWRRCRGLWWPDCCHSRGRGPPRHVGPARVPCKRADLTVQSTRVQTSMTSPEPKCLRA